MISCLRGMAVTLDVQHSYLEAMRPYAKQALLRVTLTVMIRARLMVWMRSRVPLAVA